MDANAIVENFRRIVTTQYIDFEGRTARDVFWYYVLAYIVLYVIASVLESILGFGALGPFGYFYYNPRPLTGLLLLALLLPSLGIAARRLHDTGRSAWWLLIGLIPLVGWLILVYWYVRPGTVGTNQFGPDPKGVIVVPPTP